MFGITTKRIDRELEARLSPPGGGGGTGKVERKWYRDGSGKLAVKAKRLGLPNGTALSVFFDDLEIGTLEIRNGAGRLRLDSDNGDSLPAAETGQAARILHGGETVLTGRFYAD